MRMSFYLMLGRLQQITVHAIQTTFTSFSNTTPLYGYHSGRICSDSTLSHGGLASSVAVYEDLLAFFERITDQPCYGVPSSVSKCHIWLGSAVNSCISVSSYSSSRFEGRLLVPIPVSKAFDEVSDEVAGFKLIGALCSLLVRANNLRKR